MSGEYLATYSNLRIKVEIISGESPISQFKFIRFVSCSPSPAPMKSEVNFKKIEANLFPCDDFITDLYSKRRYKN
jgi:hypothetical protein